MNDREALIILVDWLGATLPFQAPEEVYGLVGIPESEWMDGKGGMHGYAKQKVCGNIRILYAGGADMGVHVQFSGQGCREYEHFYSSEGGNCWVELIVRILQAGGSFSRLDFAIDEIRYDGDTPYWTVEQVIEKAAAKEVRTRFKRGRRMEDIYFYKEKEGGKTFYFGSDHSLIQFVVYMKDKEREANDETVEKEITTWNRFEIRLADDRAQTAAEWVSKGMEASELVFGIISNYLMMCDPTGDSNRSRWPVCDWWMEYLNAARKLKLAHRAPDKTIEQKANWLDRQTYPTIAQIWYAHGSPDPGPWIADMIEQGLERMTEQQAQLAQEYRERMLKEEGNELERKQTAYERRQEERRVENLERRERLALALALEEVAAGQRLPDDGEIGDLFDVWANEQIKKSRWNGSSQDLHK